MRVHAREKTNSKILREKEVINLNFESIKRKVIEPLWCSIFMRNKTYSSM